MIYNTDFEKYIKERLELEKIGFKTLSIKVKVGTWHNGITIKITYEENSMSKEFRISLRELLTGCGIMQLYSFAYLTEIDELTSKLLDICLDCYKDECTQFICTLGQSYEYHIKNLKKYWKFKQLVTYNNKKHGNDYRQTLFTRCTEKEKTPTEK